MPEITQPSQKPGKEDDKKKQGSPQESDERPPEKDAPSADGGSPDAVPRRPRRLGPLGQLDICEN